MQNVIIKNELEEGQTIMLSDVELPESKALQAWLATEKRVLTNGSER